MSGTEHSATAALEEHLRLGAGFAAADRPRILEALSALAPHLSGWEHDQVDLEVSLNERDLDHALAEVRRDLIRQIDDERSRRQPRKRRKTRYRTT
jgi:hypothetical protein